MLIIRADQMQAFRTAMLRSFEGEMVSHLADFSPPLFDAVGSEQLRKTVQLGIARAANYELTHRGPVRLYLELMLMFGSHFDSDPQYPWASGILGRQKQQSQTFRAQLLHEKALDYRHEVAGPEDAYTFEALKRMRSMAAQPPPLASGDFVTEMLREIALVYPQKAAYVGTEGLEALVREGVEAAHAYALSTHLQAALVIVLRLAFGHGCADDPLYPWIGATLRDERIVDSAARARRLTSKALTWLDHVLEHFGEAP